MGIVIVAIIIGLIPAFIAQSKGRNFLLWWLYGTCIFIVAIPHSIIIKADQETLEYQQRDLGMKKCPFCAEMIKQDAVVCRYCSRDLPLPNVTESNSTDPSSREVQKKQLEETRLKEGKCPHCGTVLKPRAKACHFCYRELPKA